MVYDLIHSIYFQWKIYRKTEAVRTGSQTLFNIDDSNEAISLFTEILLFIVMDMCCIVYLVSTSIEFI